MSFVDRILDLPTRIKAVLAILAIVVGSLTLFASTHSHKAGATPVAVDASATKSAANSAASSTPKASHSFAGGANTVEPTATTAASCGSNSSLSAVAEHFATAYIARSWQQPEGDASGLDGIATPAVIQAFQGLSPMTAAEVDNHVVQSLTAVCDYTELQSPTTASALVEGSILQAGTLSQREFPWGATLNLTQSAPGVWEVSGMKSQ